MCGVREVSKKKVLCERSLYPQGKPSCSHKAGSLLAFMQPDGVAPVGRSVGVAKRLSYGESMECCRGLHLLGRAAAQRGIPNASHSRPRLTRDHDAWAAACCRSLSWFRAGVSGCEIVTVLVAGAFDAPVAKSSATACAY